VQEATERKLKLQLMEMQAQCENARLKAETERIIERAKADELASRVRALIEAGLSPLQVSNFLVSEVSVVGLSKAEKVMIGMPQGLIGLRGAEHVYANYEGPSHHDTFVKV